MIITDNLSGEKVEIPDIIEEEIIQDNSNKIRNAKIVNLIRKVYSLDDELAIQRKRDVEPEAFQDYFDYVEQCKMEVR